MFYSLELENLYRYKMKNKNQDSTMSTFITSFALNNGFQKQIIYEIILVHIH